MGYANAHVGPKVRKDLGFAIPVRVYRDYDGHCHTNVWHQWVWHSPTGFEWGYLGSGPADLALNILLRYLKRDWAAKLHQQFKEEFIAVLPRDMGTVYTLDPKAVKRWLDERNLPLEYVS